MKRSILLCQDVHRWGVVGPGVELAVEDVGEVAFERASGFAGGLAFGHLVGEEGFGGGLVSLLDDGDAVERGVELSVAAAVEAVAAGGWPEPQGIGAAPQKRAKAAASRKRRTSPA